MHDDLFYFGLLFICFLCFSGSLWALWSKQEGVDEKLEKLKLSNHATRVIVSRKMEAIESKVNDRIEDMEEQLVSAVARLDFLTHRSIDPTELDVSNPFTDLSQL